MDSITGTITRIYDGLDRLTSEATPQGAVSFAYDAAGRRTSMTVAGQPSVSYSFDNANRLTQVTQGTSAVSFAYDTAGRRTSLTLPNGVVASYSYDAGSHLIGITYSLGVTTLGNLSYGYDNAGRRVTTGGSFARTGLPLAVTATYNAANQLTQWGTATLTYDLNGNMTSSGSDGYTWDARNRLVSTLSGASFQYDAFGRRVSQTIGGTTTNYLYDGVNAVQEIQGAVPTANLLTGLGVDEIFTRTDAAGTANSLADALGSTLALTDATGTVATQYTYEPFGKTTVSGLPSANPYQYTGRENDGTGLYFYRARYYSPVLQRFISEDPIEFAGGINLYAYVGNNPIGLVDPLGLKPRPRWWPPWLPWPWGLPEDGPPKPIKPLRPITGPCTPSVFNPSCKPPSCPAVFLNSAANALDLPVFPAGSGPEDAAMAAAAAAATKHIIDRGLSVPLRSSIVRNLLLGGELLADAIVFVPVIYQESVGLIDEVKAWRAGTCTTIWSN